MRYALIQPRLCLYLRTEKGVTLGYSSQRDLSHCHDSLESVSVDRYERRERWAWSVQSGMAASQYLTGLLSVHGKPL